LLIHCIAPREERDVYVAAVCCFLISFFAPFLDTEDVELAGELKHTPCEDAMHEVFLAIF